MEADWEEAGPQALPLPARAEAAATETLEALRGLLAREGQTLCSKKALYVRLGCRGDWPDLQPPSWAPPDAATGAPL